MVGEVFAGISALKTAFDIAKTIKDTNDVTIRQAIAIELQEKIFSAQQAQALLIEEVNSLKAEIAGFETWDAEKQRYELKPIGTQGVFAYSLKPEHENGEPPHWICPDCYQDRKKSILQTVIKTPGMARVAICQRCKFSTYTSGIWQKEHK